MSEDGMYLYHIAIIDYLQDFNWSKKAENLIKSKISNGKLISAVPAEQYGRRFFEFMQTNVITNQMNPKTLKYNKVNMDEELNKMK